MFAFALTPGLAESLQTRWQALGRPDSADQTAWRQLLGEFAPGVLGELARVLEVVPPDWPEAYEQQRRLAGTFLPAGSEQPEPSPEQTQPLTGAEGLEGAAERLARSLGLLRDGPSAWWGVDEGPLLVRLRAVCPPSRDRVRLLEFLHWLEGWHAGVRLAGDIPPGALRQLTAEYCYWGMDRDDHSFARTVQGWLRHGGRPSPWTLRWGLRRGGRAPAAGPVSTRLLARYDRVRLHGLLHFADPAALTALAEARWRELNALTGEEFALYYGDHGVRRRTRGVGGRRALRAAVRGEGSGGTLVPWQERPAEAQTVPLAGLSDGDVVQVVAHLASRAGEGGALGAIARGAREYVAALSAHP